MLKEKLKKFMPDKNTILNSKSMQIFGKLIHDPNLWHLNRTSVYKAFAVGLFCAWIPVPFQMVLAGIGAIFFHSNLALSVGLVWITNPFTMPPMFVFAYKIGALIISVPITKNFKFSLSLEWLLSTLQEKWKPLLLGCLICATISSIIGSILINYIWKYFTIRSWKKRKKLRNKN